MSVPADRFEQRFDHDPEPIVRIEAMSFV